LEKIFRELLNSGRRYPITDLSMNVHFHGHLGSILDHSSKKPLQFSPSNISGILKETNDILPDEPGT